DGVEQRGLAVVDVAHDRHDRRAGLQVAVFVGNVEDAFFDVGFRYTLDGMTEFNGDEFSQVGVDQIAGLHHLACRRQELADVHSALGHALRQFLDGDGFRQDHFAHYLLTRLLHHGALELLLAATHGRERTAALRAILVGRGGRQRQLALTTAVVGLRTGWYLRRFRTLDGAAVRGRAATRTLVFVLVVFTAATGNGAGRGDRRTDRLRARFRGSRRCRPCHNLFLGGSRGGGLAGAALGLFLLALNALFFLDLAASFLFH